MTMVTISHLTIFERCEDAAADAGDAGDEDDDDELCRWKMYSFPRSLAVSRPSLSVAHSVRLIQLFQSYSFSHRLLPQDPLSLLTLMWRRVKKKKTRRRRRRRNVWKKGWKIQREKEAERERKRETQLTKRWEERQRSTGSTLVTQANTTQVCVKAKEKTKASIHESKRRKRVTKFTNRLLGCSTCGDLRVSTLSLSLPPCAFDVRTSIHMSQGGSRVSVFSVDSPEATRDREAQTPREHMWEKWRRRLCSTQWTRWTRSSPDPSCHRQTLITSLFVCLSFTCASHAQCKWVLGHRNLYEYTQIDTCSRPCLTEPSSNLIPQTQRLMVSASPPLRLCHYIIVTHFLPVRWRGGEHTFNGTWSPWSARPMSVEISWCVSLST